MNILIVNNPIAREFNVEHWYEYIRDNPGPNKITLVADANMRIDTLDEYDVIFEGASSSYVSVYAKYLPKNVKLVKHTLDQWCDMDRWRTWFRNGPPPYDLIVSTGNWLNTLDMSNAWPHIPIKHIMLPVDDAVYKFDQSVPKEYDILHQCTVNIGWPFHEHRLKAQEILSKSKGIKVCNPITWTSQEQYIDNMHKSKMMFFDHSMRGYFLQKVMDASYCGTPLIGSAPPSGFSGVFLRDVTYIESIYPFDDLASLVRHWSKVPDDLILLADNMRRRLLHFYNIRQQTYGLLEVLGDLNDQ